MIRHLHPFFIFLFWITGTGFCGSLFSQNYWFQKAGSPLIDEGLDISKDAAGNTYATGYFSGTAVFSTTVTLVSYGSTDIFIAKYNPQGVLQWAVQAGGNLPDKGLSIKTDNAGNSYITGFFYGTASFGSLSISASGNSQDIFIAKYNTNGNVIWVQKGGGNSGDIANGIALDLTGIYITGEFMETAQFGSISLTSMLNPSTQLPSVDIFIAKLDTSGNFIWAKKGSAKYTDRGLDIATDGAGNVYTTGQFSDTLNFANTYNNNSFNTIFLVKHDANGNEIWFRRAGGGIQNIAYGIAIDASNNIYLAGDAKGNIIFWGNSLTNLNTAYSNNIFVAKYDNTGEVLWVADNGSDNFVSARNISLDNNGNPFVIGNFKCVFSEYSNSYGSGIFNSVGFSDIFVSAFSSAGNWLWARHCGGRGDDFGNGIVADDAGLPYICGSFQQKIYFPSGGDFLGYDLYTAYTNNFNYCNDQNYNSFVYSVSEGNSDIAIGKVIDPDRQPYDYYDRELTGCDRDFIGICINNNCPDTIVACKDTFLFSHTNTSYSVGPQFNYLWSNGVTFSNTIVNQSGIYNVTATTADGCFSSYDSIFVKINSPPSKPTITDDIIINNNAINPQLIELCEDSVTLTGGNYSSDYFFYWKSSLFPLPVDSSVITVNTTGTYSFIVTDSNGCVDSNFVEVRIFSPLPAFNPNIILLDGSNDSIAFCKEDCFRIQLYDQITNPDNPTETCFPSDVPYTTSAIWNVTPYITFSSCPICGNAYADFCPDSSGTYEISAMLIRRNLCDSDTFLLNITVFAEVYPEPQINLNIAFDRNIICPVNDSVLLVATGWTEYTWQTPAGIQTGDSIWANEVGSYSIYIVDSNSYGCKKSSSAAVFITQKPQPQIFSTPNNALLCPDSTVLLTVTTNGNYYNWFGPSGQIPINANSITVNLPGYYMCLVTDSDSCTLTSNSIEVKEYATPILVVTPNDTVCPGNNVTLTVVTNPGSQLLWESPLSGNALVQIVNETGIYTCNVSSCGVVTPVSTYITASTTVFQFLLTGSDTFCEWDSVILSATPGLNSYQWSTGESGTDSITVTQSGNYFVVATDSLNCEFYSDTILLNAIPSPGAPVAEDETICKGSFATLSAIGSGTVEWYDNASGGTLIDTGNIYITPLIYGETQFFIEVNNGGLCPSERVQLTVFVDSLSLMQMDPSASYNTISFGDTTQLFANCAACASQQTLGYSWSPSASLTASSELNPLAYPNEKTTYILQISDSLNSQCIISDSVTIEVRQLICGEPEIFVPNAFTPNNDNKNDVVFVRGNKVKTMYFVVLDRWGEKIFETENQSLGWDGTYRGMKCDPAVFVYYLKGTCLDGQELFMKGNITLIK